MKQLFLGLSLLFVVSLFAQTPNNTELIGNADFSNTSLFTDGPTSFAVSGTTLSKWYAGGNDPSPSSLYLSYNTSNGFQNSISTGSFAATIPVNSTNIYENFLGQVTTEQLNTGRYRFSIDAKGNTPIYLKISSKNLLGAELTFALKNASSAGIAKSSENTGYSLKITPTDTWTTYTADLDLSNATPSTVRMFFVFPKAGAVSVDNISLKRTQDIPEPVIYTTYYIRPTGNTTAWNNISGINADQIVTSNALSFIGTNTYYFAAGSYTIPSIVMTTGKLYGGFSGNETSIDLNARATNDKDGNGIAEPWELTNETIITSSAANRAYTESGVSSRFMSVTGGEVNGFTFSDYHYNQASGNGAIILGALSSTPTDGQNISTNAGAMKYCTIRKFKTTIGSGTVMMTNSASVIDKCLIEGCRVMSSTGHGGAIYMSRMGGIVSNSVLRNNIAGGHGGAIYLGNTSTGTNYTGTSQAAFSAIVRNCAVYNNTAGYNSTSAGGGAIRGEATTTSSKGLEVINCTVVNNTTASSSGIASIEFISSGVLANSIVLSDAKGEIRPNSTTNYVASTIYGANAGSALYPATNCVNGIADDTFTASKFKTPTTFKGAVGNSIDDVSTYTDALNTQIKAANYSITSTSSNAVTTTSATLPATYKAAGGTGADIAITATVPSSDMLSASRTVNYTLGAYQYRTPQTITFNALTPVTYGAATFNLTATASSNLSVSYTSSNTAVATVSGNTVTIVGAGSTNISASQVGTTDVMIATTVVQPLTVNQKNLTITSPLAQTKMYDGNVTASITGTLSGVINSDTVSLVGTGTFADATPGTGKAVTSTATLTGAKSGNYVLIQPTGLTADISVPAPTANAQTFCVEATVANLVATGTNLKWYAVTSGGSALDAATPLTTGTYYVSQTLAGVESTNRTSVTVTFQAAANAGTDGTLNVPTAKSPSDADLFAALTSADSGGTWSRPAEIAGVYTYTVTATSPCTSGDTATVKVSEVIPDSFSVCAGTKISDIVGSSSLKFYADVKPATVAISGTTDTALKAPKTYFVTQFVGGIESTPRKSVQVMIIALPAIPGTITGTAEQGPLVGTTTQANYSISPVVGATSYEWIAPTGVNIIGANNGTSVTVNFANVGAGAGAIGNLSVKSVNSSGCSSVAKILALTKALPAAPSALKMTDENVASPATGVYAAVTSFAKHMGTDYELTLTATASPTATSYTWELPEGVHVTKASATDVNGILTSVSNKITINFKDVTKLNTYNYTDAKGVSTNLLRIGVKAVNGVGSSVTDNQTKPLTPITTESKAKLVTLTAVAPAAPTALVLNDGNTATAITVISKLIGHGGMYRLAAAVPAATLASSFEWELPSCATRVTSLTDPTQVSGATTDPFIYVKFTQDAIASPGAIYFGVKAVNGIGSSVTDNQTKPLIPATESKAKLLRLVTAVPAAPTALVLNDGNTSTAITVISKLIGHGGTYRLAAAVPAATLASSFEWELPSCATRVTSMTDSTQVSGTTTDPFIYVKFTQDAIASPGAIYFGVKAVNGIGSSVTDNQTKPLIPATESKAKLLSLVTAVPAAPTALVLNDLASATPATAVTVVSKYIGTSTKLKLTASVPTTTLANYFTWALPQGVNRVDESGNIVNETSSTDSFIYVNFANVSHEATPISIVLGVVAVNNVGSSVSTNTGANSTRTDKLYTVTATIPAKVATLGGSLSVCNRAEGFTYTITAPVGAKSYIITAPAGSVVSSATGVAGATPNVLTTSELTFNVVYNGNTPFSKLDKYLQITSVNDFGNSTTAFKSAAMTKQADCPSLANVARLAVASATEEFNVIAYPNPSSDVFTLEVQSSGKRKSTTVIQVYDMTGRLIEQRQVQSNSVEVGNNYPTGVYNVIVTQDVNVKTLRVMKR